MELRNNKGGEVIQSPLTHEEACKQFAELYGKSDHWALFWIHKAVLDRPKKETQAALTSLANAFMVAIGYGLKMPKIRCHYKDRRFKFYLSGRGTICLKTGELRFLSCSCGAEGDHDIQENCRLLYSNDPVGNEKYAGCLNEGKFLLPGRDSVRNLLPTEKEFLERLEADPMKFLSDCSKDMGRCCYCNLPLEDPTSKRVGYGKVCAGRWGLPWGDKRYVEKAPSFAKCYDSDAAGMLEAIRQHPRDADSWSVFADWLEEQGMSRCRMPQAGVVIPRG